MGFSRALFPCSHGRGKERGGLRGSELAGLPTEEVEEEDAALSIRGADPGDHARAVGKESQDLSRKGGKRLSQAEAQLSAFQDQGQVIGQDHHHDNLPARKDRLMKMIAGRLGLLIGLPRSPGWAPTLVFQLASEPQRGGAIDKPEVMR
jgi:hypothetical protein